MIVVGIPTYNEAENISHLTRLIDNAALEKGIEVIIVNADSASDDTTPAIFMETNTRCEKVSLQNNIRGKGYNIRSILEYTARHDEAEGCILIDGDVTSFESNWLSAYRNELESGVDYVIPTYARNYQEGNTTNHFVYPLLGMHWNGVAPRQPISGDFGISKRFAQHLLAQVWHEYAYGYGIDVFMTLHAMSGGFNVAEIMLGKKLHKPSFDKMVPMFKEVAASYYKTTQILGIGEQVMTVNVKKTEAVALIETTALPQTDIDARRDEAINFFKNSPTLLRERHITNETRIDQAAWSEIIIEHEKLAQHHEATVVAESILPWYLRRVVTYLEKCTTAEAASQQVSQQFDFIVKSWQDQIATKRSKHSESETY